MNRVGNLLLVLLLFGVGFGATFWLQTRGSGSSAAALFIPKVECDVTDEKCRARYRAQAELLFSAGDDEAGSRTLERLAAVGDKIAPFQLGWHYEEIYRAAVGRKLAAGTAIEEERRYGVRDLPRGEAFDALVARQNRADAGDRPTRARALAFLWYAKAAQGGSAAAMNNLANMYRFGLMGTPDLVSARKWFLEAYDAGSPVAAYNLENMRIKGYGIAEIDCVELDGNGWLPLVNKPSDTDLSVMVFPRTRFRGRGLDRPMVELIGMDVLGVTDPAAWARARGVPPQEITWLNGALNLMKYGDADWDYDDEAPIKPKDMPTFAEVQARAAKNAEQRGSCRGHSADRRSRAVEAERDRREALMERTLGGDTGTARR